MEINIIDVPTNPETNKVEIDSKDNSGIYIVANGVVKKVPLPRFGTLELPCQNYKIGTVSCRLTAKL